jgi:sugar/nucleoside kinase (ribokinase family)
MNTIQIIGLGALNIDHIKMVERILEDGEAVVLDSYSTPGGSAANTIYGLAKLGVSTAFCGVVGDDDYGKTLLQDFRKVGVDASRIRVKNGAKTGTVLCLSGKLGKRSLYVVPSANSLLVMDDLDPAYINQAKMLHLASFAGERQFKVLLQLMDKLDLSVKLSFAPGALYAVKELKNLAPILKRTYILFLNQSEMWQLTGKDVTSGAESCLRQGCQKVVVTLGKEAKVGKVNAVGYIRDAEGEYLIKPQDLGASIDTTGAGDAFAAGFLYGIVNNKSLEECGRLGNIVAQFCIAKIGAREGLPTLRELAQRYQELYNQKL